MSTCLINRATCLSPCDGEEALEIRAFGEADGMIDGVAGAVDLSQGPARVRRRPMHRRKEVGGGHPAGARSHDERAAGRQHAEVDPCEAEKAFALPLISAEVSARRVSGDG